MPAIAIVLQEEPRLFVPESVLRKAGYRIATRWALEQALFAVKALPCRVASDVSVVKMEDLLDPGAYIARAFFVGAFAN